MGLSSACEQAHQSRMRPTKGDTSVAPTSAHATACEKLSDGKQHEMRRGHQRGAKNRQARVCTHLKSSVQLQAMLCCFCSVSTARTPSHVDATCRNVSGSMHASALSSLANANILVLLSSRFVAP